MSKPSPAPSAVPSLDVEREQQMWRERALRGLALSLAVTGAAISLWFLLVKTPEPQLVPFSLGATLLLSAVVLAPRAPFILRVSTLLVAVYGLCSSALWLAGFAPNPFIGFGALSVIGTLLLGRRVGLLLVCGTTVTVAAIAAAQWAHLIERVPHWEENVDSTNVRTILRVLGVFGLVSSTLVLSVSYLLSRSEELVLEKARSLEALRQEQLERERITRDLELREAAFHKARELELLGRLAGSMAHDFNNALLVIWASLDEVALSQGLPEAARRALADLRAAAEQASATTRQLRAFGPMGPRRPSQVALAPVLEKARVMFGRVLPQNIQLSAEVLADEARIVADEGEILRVLMNLALNARDAMRDGGKLTLRLRTLQASEEPLAPGEREVVVLEVEDTGSGMSEAVKSRVFEPFFTTKQALGTGLGLASVRDVVVAHGGRVEVASELGIGTKISLFWPAASASAPSSVAPSSVRSMHEPLIVLLVDDDAAVRFALKRSLERAGMSVLEAADVAAALILAERHTAPIHVLCTDCVMSGPPVRQLIARFRELHAGRVLVCSGYAPDETGLSPDAFDDFLPKPFSGTMLVERIHALVEPKPAAPER